LGITTGLTAALAVVMMYVIDRPELRSATSAESLIMRVFPILIAVTVVPVFMTAVTPILRRLAENSRDERAKTEHAGKTADEKAVEEKKGG
jgi:NADH:ubiquinone oxidoreductase subunit 6 (subunit J)